MNVLFCPVLYNLLLVLGSLCLYQQLVSHEFKKVAGMIRPV